MISNYILVENISLTCINKGGKTFHLRILNPYEKGQGEGEWGFNSQTSQLYLSLNRAFSFTVKEQPKTHPKNLSKKKETIKSLRKRTQILTPCKREGH